MICEVDEYWSFVRNKKNQRWLWYAWKPRLKRIIAHTFGRRDNETFKELLTLLQPFDIRFFCTDDFKVYKSEIPAKNHITGKYWTQRIERNNLNLRTRLKWLNRKAIGCSKCPEVHDKVIGTFIEREFY